MIRCDSCGAETVFLSPQKDCFDCAQHDPLERAAIALFDEFTKCDPAPQVPWDSPKLDHTTLRRIFRRRADLVLRAAIDVDELAEHIGKEHAAIVHTHLLGSAAP